MKYKEWLNIWLENYVKPTAKMWTYERYSQIVKQLNSEGDFRKIQQKIPNKIENSLQMISYNYGAENHDELKSLFRKSIHFYQVIKNFC